MSFIVLFHAQKNASYRCITRVHHSQLRGNLLNFCAKHFRFKEIASMALVTPATFTKIIVYIRLFLLRAVCMGTCTNTQMETHHVWLTASTKKVEFQLKKKKKNQSSSLLPLFFSKFCICLCNWGLIFIQNHKGMTQANDYLALTLACVFFFISLCL